MTTPDLTTSIQRARRRARRHLFLAAVFFGLLAVLARLASRGAGGFSAGQLGVVRFAVGLAAVLGYFRVRPGTFQANDKLLLAGRGLLGGLAVLLYFLALARLPAGEATLLNNTFPVFSTLLAIALLGERATLQLLLALLLTVVGAVMVMGGGGLRPSLGIGELAGIGSAIFGGAAVVCIRVLRPNHNTPTVFFAFCLGGLIVLLPFSRSSWPDDPWRWASALGAGLVAIAAQVLMTHTLGYLKVTEAAIWQQLTPVMSYLFALALLDERMTAGAAAGVLLVLVGVAWGAAFGHRAPSTTAGQVVAEEESKELLERES